MFKRVFSLFFTLMIMLFIPLLGDAKFEVVANYLEDNLKQTEEKNIYSVSPSLGLPGKDYEVVVTVPQCNPSSTLARKLKLGTLKGSDITVSFNEEKSSACFIVASLSIDKNAKLGKVFLPVQEENKVIAYAEFEVVSVSPGPVPPGINPQVDIMWNVLPEDIVHDNFGRRISDKYYCIEIIVGNNSGYALQVAGVGFKLPDLEDPKKVSLLPPVPSSSYQMVRGTLERTQEVGSRNILITGLKAFGPIATGFIPFFRSEQNKTPRLNFTQGVAIFSGPVTQFFELVFPDTTVRQLVRLDTQALRNGLVIANNTQVLTIVFFPKNFFPLITDKSSPEEKKYGLSQIERANPQKVMRKLGCLVLIGDQVQYINRVQVTADSQNKGIVPPPSINSGQQFSIQEGDETEKSFVISGNFLDNPTLVYPQGKMQITDIKADANGKSISAKIKVNKDTPAGNYPLVISTSGGTADYSLLVTKKAEESKEPVKEQFNSTEVEIPKLFGSPINVIPKNLGLRLEPSEKAVKLLFSGTDIMNADILFKNGFQGKSFKNGEVDKNGKKLLRVIIVLAKETNGDFPLIVRVNSKSTDVVIKLPDNIAQENDVE